ncbi:NAD-dependent epimerase/dehydratase family protein [Labrys wisconsinensis]|uniref:Nucleoside-diphosphate-sugar epimerase n=1 Tax=Labrys wisconsinensis TaxID=425677 RepID=A0ABU0JBG2_9HYPH|nr:NAD(P)-dependent oxidoreductase [Labrys wisconsinensis]MDQ0470492.1 nucleoside-diphosphate-sugar epimerase [Labrys wisconsinensis]
MKVAVTGSSGLLGRHVAAALAAAGHEVLGIDTAPPPPGAAWQHAAADAGDLGALAQLMRGAGAVAHIAAIPRPTGRAPAEVFSVNVRTAYAAVEAAILAGAGRFVYASSFSVLGYPFFERPVTPPYLPVDEGHPIGAQDPYGLSKWLGEEIVEAAVRRGAFDAVSLRMPWIQTPASFFAEVGPRRQTPQAARDLWSYLDARDAAAAFVAAVERPLAGHVRLFLSAADSFAEEATETLVRRAYPGVPLVRPIPGTGALIDTARARVALGFEPRHAWRSYDRAGGT